MPWLVSVTTTLMRSSISPPTFFIAFPVPMLRGSFGSQATETRLRLAYQNSSTTWDAGGTIIYRPQRAIPSSNDLNCRPSTCRRCSSHVGWGAIGHDHFDQDMHALW